MDVHVGILASQTEAVRRVRAFCARESRRTSTNILARRLPVLDDGRPEDPSSIPKLDVLVVPDLPERRSVLSHLFKAIDVASSGFELICVVHSKGMRAQSAPPSASPNGCKFSVCQISEIEEALRKAILKRSIMRRFDVRTIAPHENAALCDFFRLRYDVFSALGYIPATKLCTQTKMEFDYTDRSALPLGVYSREDGRLVGCGRLVFQTGQEMEHAPTITALATKADSPILASAINYPTTMTHPFDILESFAAFRTYFARLTRENVRVAEVSRVIVANEVRQTGAGEAIVDSLVECARERSVQLLLLACRAEHTRLYARSGFSLVPKLRCDKFVNVATPAVAMERRDIPKRLSGVLSAMLVSELVQGND